MASKQLGKLRQWAGEVISSRDKTVVTEEFKELERDISIRKDGLQKLFYASEAYHSALSKKKLNEGLNDTEKYLPIDTLGIVMIVHGEEFGDDSAFGTSLVKLGRAHCKIATLQEAYALTFKDTFMDSLEGFSSEIREYESLRKKLESRRLSYDAAHNKFEKIKNSKKDKDRKEAEDELDRAKHRYDETSEDVRAHIEAIQENENNQLRDLTTLLDVEINYVKQYLEVLTEVKSDWKEKGNSHAHKKLEGNIANLSRLNKRFGARPVSSSVVVPSDSGMSRNSSEDSEEAISNSSRRQSRSGSVASKPPSRPASRMSRKRNGSITTNGDNDKEREKETGERPRRKSVTGWASNAVDSVTSRGWKSKDKDNFSELPGDEKAESPTLKKSGSFKTLSRRSSFKKSKENLPSMSPKQPPRILKPPSQQERKIVHALYDFKGSSDELSFRAGQEILVVSEVVDGWWMGNIKGRTGLFPTTYVEAGPGSPGNSDYDTDDDAELGSQPMSHQASPFNGGLNDIVGIADEEHEEESPHHPSIIVPARQTFEDFLSTPSKSPKTPTRKIHHDMSEQPLLSQRSLSENPTSVSSTSRKVPPPLPPRRSSTNAMNSPAVPERKLGYLNPSSTSLRAYKNVTPASSVSSHGYDASPFESDSEVSISVERVPGKGCSEFKQSPFQEKGMCSNCFEYHG